MKPDSNKANSILSRMGHNVNRGVLLLLAATVMLSACSDKKKSTKTEPAVSSSTANTVLSPLTSDSAADWSKGAAAGMSWSIPSDWTVGPEMPMRAGTYFAKPADGDSEPAECRVNFFGSGQGGEVDENIYRWSSQMEVESQEGKSPTPLVERTEVAGLPVAVVELSGVYLSKTRPMAKDFTRKSGFKMFAAIATAPEGTVFFKMTGPVKTMEANRENFRQMLGSITSGS